MGRVCVALLALALAGCGRIGFDAVHDTAAGSGAPADGRGDAVIVTGDGSTAGCGFVSCSPGDVACCVASETSCVPSGTCTGTQFECENGTDCPLHEACCMIDGGGSYCTLAACPG